MEIHCIFCLKIIKKYKPAKQLFVTCYIITSSTLNLLFFSFPERFLLRSWWQWSFFIFIFQLNFDMSHRYFFLIQKHFDIFPKLLFRPFFFVFDDVYLTFFYMEKITKRIWLVFCMSISQKALSNLAATFLFTLYTWFSSSEFSSLGFSSSGSFLLESEEIYCQ